MMPDGGPDPTREYPISFTITNPTHQKEKRDRESTANKSLAQNMNYAIVVSAPVWVGALMYYYLDGYKWFTGPKMTIETQPVHGGDGIQVVEIKEGIEYI
jgi:hypothetical protein